MTIRDEIQAIALLHIFEANPQLIKEIEDLNEDAFSPMSREHYRSSCLEEALAKEAKRHRLHPWDYKLKLAEQSGIDVSAIREDDRRAEADALGIAKLL